MRPPQYNSLSMSRVSTSTAAQATSESRDRLVLTADGELESLLSGTATTTTAATTNPATSSPGSLAYQTISPAGSFHPAAGSPAAADASWRTRINGGNSSKLHGGGCCSDNNERSQSLTKMSIALVLMVVFIALSVVTYPRTNTVIQVNETFYDYIVVGAGPAGIIVAVKLARALPNQTVLLLEAGTDSQTAVLKNLGQQHDHLSPFQRNTLNEFDVPLLWSGVASAQGRPNRSSTMAAITRYPSNVPTSDQYYQHHWPVGRTLLAKALGGCGLHNAMIYVRSLVSDWAGYNVTGWDFDQHILPEYIKLERRASSDQSKKHDDDAPSYHHRGTDGPILTVSSQETGAVDALAPLFVEAAKNAGLAVRKSGFNHPDPAQRVGAGYYEFNIRRGIRDSVAKTFLGQPQASSSSYQQQTTQTSSSSSSQHDRHIPSNLHIETGVTVTRVLLALQSTTDKRPAQQHDDDTSSEHHQNHVQHPRAIGVEYVETGGGKRDRIGQFLLRDDTSLGEVILSAGAILTPQLLSNSGIEDQKRRRQDHGEKVESSSSSSSPITVDLPGVGKNLQDHPVVTMGFEIDAEVALAGAVSSIYTVGSEMDEYVWSAMELDNISDQLDINKTVRTDPVVTDLTEQLGTMGTAGFSAGAFLRSPFAKDGDDSSPDIQLTIFPRHMEPHVTRESAQQKNRAWLRLLRNKAMLVTVSLLKPEARYEVQPSKSLIPLALFEHDFVAKEDNDDEEDKDTMKRVLGYRLPVIDLPAGQQRYLTPRDVDRLAWGVEQVRRIQQTDPLANHTGPELYPGATVMGKDLRGYIRDKSLANSHWAGSTKMSSDKADSMAVVDERLRVRKVDNLRIVDAGVLPKVPNGNIHSTVCVVASRAADLITHDRHEHEKIQR